jgi:glycosyltransferase involved in cell wall biosynthesis
MFTVSEASKQLLVNHVGLPRNQIDVIPNGVDTEHFHPSNNNSLRDNRIVIGTVGSLSPVKSQALLIRAWAELLKSGIQGELRLAGEGPERSRLAHVAESLGIADRVHFFGHIEDVPGFLQQLDVFVLPSDSEAHPNALIEAMSCGLPCVATRVGGVPEVLDNGRFGRLVQAGDLDGLVEAVRELANNPVSRKSLGQAARKRILDKYSLKQMVERYASLYGCNDSAHSPNVDAPSHKTSCLSTPHILMLGPTPPLTGGMATVVSNLKESSLAKQCQLVILNNGKTTSEDRSLTIGIASQLRFLGQLIITILRQKTDIVHIHTCSGFTFWRDCVHMALARLLARKVVLHIHGAKFDQFIADMNTLQQTLLKTAFEKAASVIVLSKEWLQKLRSFSPDAQWDVVPNGVIMPKKHRRMTESGANFIFLGDLSKRKGIYDLITAVGFASRHGFRGMVYLAGGETSPGQKTKVEELIRQLGIQNQVKLLGIVSGNKKTEALREADCFVLPSYAEGLPMALLEAMAYELPVITTDVGGIPEVVTDGQEGFLIKPGDIKALADRMTLLAKDKKLRQRMGRAGRRRVEENYSMNVMVERIMKVYREILDEV